VTDHMHTYKSSTTLRENVCSNKTFMVQNWKMDNY